MKRFLCLLVALACAAPAFAQNPVLDDLKAARAQFGTPLTRAELGAMLNAVALKHKDEGVGLEKKTGGDTCPQPLTNISVSCDILRFPGNVGRDVLGDSDGRAVPQWGDAGPASASTFVAPVNTGTSPVTTPIPPQPPTGDLEARLQALEARVAKLEAGTGGSTPPPAGDTLAVLREQLATSKAILELLKKTAAKFGVQ